MQSVDNKRAAPGSVLRDSRMAKGLDQATVAEDLNLLVSQVEALETNDYTRFNAEVFVRGFISRYAEYLGLNDALLLDDCEHLFRQAEKQKRPPPRRIGRAADAHLRAILALVGAVIIWGIAVLVFNGGDGEPAAQQHDTEQQP